MSRKFGENYNNKSTEPTDWHPLYGAHHHWAVEHSSEVAPGLIRAVVNDQQYNVTHLLYATWYSSGNQSGYGSYIVYDGRIEVAERLPGFKRLEYHMPKG